MKKLKLTIILLISLVILCSIPVISNAAGSFTASISKTTVTVGDTFTVTVKSTNAAGQYTVTANNTNATITQSGSGFLDSSSETWTFKAQKAGTVTITAKTTDMIDSDDDTKNVTGTKTFTVTIKEKSNNNSSSGSSSGSSGNTSSGGNSSSGQTNNNTTSKKPTFTSVNKKVYTTNDVNLRSSWSTSSSAVLVDAGTELTLTGTSKEVVNGYIWYRVTYKGATKYIASNFVTETKPEDKDYPETIKSKNCSLSSLTIESLTLNPEFNNDVLEYTATLEENVTKLNVTAKAESNKSKVEISGNDNIKDGENTIKIKVTAEDGTTKTYTVKVLKGVESEIPVSTQVTNTDDVDDGTLKLKSLEIENVDFMNGFNPNQHYYELSLNLVVDQLNITAVANKEDATIEILGNSNFTEGENLVTILVKSASGDETANYQIKVNLPIGVVQKQDDIIFYIKCVAVAFAVLLIILVIVILSKRGKKKEQNKFDYIDLEEDTMPTSKMEDENNVYSEKNEQEDDSDYFSDDIGTNKKQKNSRGKHSI